MTQIPVPLNDKYWDSDQLITEVYHNGKWISTQKYLNQL